MYLMDIQLYTAVNFVAGNTTVAVGDKLVGRISGATGFVTDDFSGQRVSMEQVSGTFIDGEGLWKGELEQTKIFYLELPDSEVEHTRWMFEQIAIKYKQAFNQDSVLISVIESKLAFV